MKNSKKKVKWEQNRKIIKEKEKQEKKDKQ